MQRSILVLILTLSLVVVLTALIFENAPTGDLPASKFNHSAARTYGVDTSTLDVQGLMKLGGEEWRRGDLKAAESHFYQALQLEPENPEILQAMGQVAYVSGDYMTASRHFGSYAEVCPNRVESYTNQSITYLCMDDLEKAEATARTGLDLAGHETPGPFFLILACVNDRKGNSEEEAVYLQHAYDALGSQLLNLVNTRWASSLKESAEYKTILEVEALKYQDGPNGTAAIPRPSLGPQTLTLP